MISFLVVFSGVLLLVSAWMLANADVDARKYFPLQFTDELSSRYLHAVRAVQSVDTPGNPAAGRVFPALAWVAFVGCAGVAYLADNPVVALLLLLVCGFGVANVVLQWRRARR